MQRNNEVSLTSRLSQTNIAVLAAATSPSEATGPKSSRKVILSVIAGALLAAGAALTLELFDRRVRSAADLLELSRGGVLPVLAEIRGLDLSKPSRPRALARPAASVSALQHAT